MMKTTLTMSLMEDLALQENGKQPITLSNLMMENDGSEDDILHFGLHLPMSPEILLLKMLKTSMISNSITMMKKKKI